MGRRRISLCIKFLWIFILFGSSINSGAADPKKITYVLWNHYRKQLFWMRDNVDYFQLYLHCDKTGTLEKKVKGNSIVLVDLPTDQCCLANLRGVKGSVEGPLTQKLMPPYLGKIYQIVDLKVDVQEKSVVVAWTTWPNPVPGAIYKFSVDLTDQNGKNVTKELYCNGIDCTYPCGYEIFPTGLMFDPYQERFNATFLVEYSSAYTVDIQYILADWTRGKIEHQFNTTTKAVSGRIDTFVVTQYEQGRADISWQLVNRIDKTNITYQVILVPNNCSEQGVSRYETVNTSISIPVFSHCNYTIELGGVTETGRRLKAVHHHIFVEPTEQSAPTKTFETIGEPLMQAMKSCKRLDDPTRSVTLKMSTDFMCNNSFGGIMYRGILVTKVISEEEDIQGHEPADEVSILSDVEDSFIEYNFKLGNPNHTHIVKISQDDVPCEGNFIALKDQCDARSGDSALQNFDFVVGKEYGCEDFQCNKLLSPGTSYRFKAFVCTWTECIAMKSTKIKTDLPDTSKKTHENKGMYAAIVISVIAAFIILAGIVVLYRKMRRKSDDPGFHQFRPESDTERSSVDLGLNSS